MLKRTVSIICATLLLLTTFAGCGGAAAPEGAASTSAVTASAASGTAPAPAGTATNDKKWDGKTLTFVSFLNQGGTAPREKSWQKVFDNFKEKTGITVEMQTTPWEEIDNQLILRTQSGSAPDVSVVRYQNFMRDIQAKALYSIDDFVARDFTPEQKAKYLMWDKCGYADGKKYCIPASLLCITLVGRKDLLTKAGVQIPETWTWDKFIEAAQKVNSPERPAILLECSPNQKTQLDWLQPIIESMGGKILDENGKAVFDSPQGVAAFQLLKDFIWKYKITPVSTASLSTNEVIDNFTAGNAAFILLASQRYTVQSTALGNENLFITQIPSNTPGKPAPTVALPWMLGIPSTAADPEMSWEFVKFFCSEESQLINLQDAGEIPCVNSLNNNPVMQSDFGKVVSFCIDYMTNNSSTGVGPATYSELADIIATSLQEVVLTENSDVQGILTKACQNYNSLK